MTATALFQKIKFHEMKWLEDVNTNEKTSLVIEPSNHNENNNNTGIENSMIMGIRDKTVDLENNIQEFTGGR